jgi:replicative DNA helicase Mcm
VLKVHKAGELREHGKMEKSSKKGDSSGDKALDEAITPTLEADFLRKYIAYAKTRIFPVLSDEAFEEIKNYYVNIRASSEDSIPFTPRQLEAFVRLTEASARVRLAAKAEIEDARRAIGIVEYYLRKVGVDRETGRFDIDVITTGISHSLHERMRMVIDIIKKLCSESKSGLAARDEIIHEAGAEGIDPSKSKEVLTKLIKNGQIYEPKANRYSLT